MKAIWLKYKVVIVILLIVAVIVGSVLIYYSILKKGIKDGKALVLADIPTPANDAPYTDQELREIRRITSSLEKMMSGFGWSWLWSDYSSITDLNQATTRIQKAVYQLYNTETTSNLIDDINTLKSANYNFSQMRNLLIAKLKAEVA